MSRKIKTESGARPIQGPSDPDARCMPWQIENVRAKEYTKHGFRFDHNCANIIVRNCTADLSIGDTTWYDFAELFPVGFLVDDPGTDPPNSNITFERCLALHHRLNG